ncbi:MAG: DUF429 domain-containing protein [Planctomycetia bacterium]|nr:DUF429 domain-containing protein [Planctomycetia bacterium]
MSVEAGSTVIGIDFTSAPSRRKPITVASGRIVSGTRRPVYRLDGIFALESLEAFDAFLRDDRPWLGGFDLPFGQPRTLIEHEGWPTDWPAFVRFYCRQPRELLRRTFKRWCDARPTGDKFAWRRADKPAGSSPAMRWTNPPVAWMMHAGIGRMLAAGLSFPAHRHGMRGASAGRRIALEAYPAFTARQACPKSYKSDTPARHTTDRRRRRAVIIAALEQGTAGLVPPLTLTPAWRRRIVADGSGDLLDAVICALQAAHAATLPRYGLPRSLDPLEGWIAAVPVG